MPEMSPFDEQSAAARVPVDSEYDSEWCTGKVYCICPACATFEITVAV